RHEARSFRTWVRFPAPPPLLTSLALRSGMRWSSAFGVLRRRLVHQTSIPEDVTSIADCLGRGPVAGEVCEGTVGHFCPVGRLVCGAGRADFPVASIEGEGLAIPLPRSWNPRESTVRSETLLFTRQSRRALRRLELRRVPLHPHVAIA